MVVESVLICFIMFVYMDYGMWSAPFNYEMDECKVKILQRNANLDGTSANAGPPPEQARDVMENS